jgi:O-antigen/teichoic acid export membrane protein
MTQQTGTNESSHTSYLKNTVFNLAGNIAPLLVGIASIPFLIKGMGTDRFGVLNIAWMLIGYFSLFDMGLGRALTQLVAEKIGKGEQDDIPAIFWTSSLLMLVLGLIGAALIASLSPLLIYRVLKIPLMLQQEMLHSVWVLSVAIPFVILTTAFIGFLSAYQRFDIINTIRLPMAIAMFASPLLVLQFSNSLIYIFAVLLLMRVIAFGAHYIYCVRLEPRLKEGIHFNSKLIKPLLRFGGWMTVSNILSPVLMYFDRFFIGAMISLSAVAYYTTPYEFVTRILVLPMALVSVIFPAFAETYIQNKKHAVRLYAQSVKYIVLCMFPVIVAVVLFAQDGMTVWLGNEFAAQSYRALQWLAIGVFFNSLAFVPFAFLQGIGKPDITSKLHLMEVAIYVPVLMLLIKNFGIDGAAMAWAARVLIDTLLLFYCAKRQYGEKTFNTPTLAFLYGTPLVLLLLLINYSLVQKVLICLLLLPVTVFYVWQKMLDQEERLFIFSIFKRVARASS